jgi:hypothetical protein
MKLAKEKVDLTWIHKEEYETLLEIWSEGSGHRSHWSGEIGEYGFRRICHTEKGRGVSTQNIFLTVRQNNKDLQVEIRNPGTGCSSIALLPFDQLIPSPRQFQKMVFLAARGDSNTLSASKTNLRIVWKEFILLLTKMPFVDHHQVHTDHPEELE